ncbi:MAG: homoserine kinase [Anaerolineales bacterium]|nr:homoserine kinase [Anaerolineales bacterium]MCB8936875.1 homoserine kinase [Ardenticatenaceae bacterium]
MKKQVTVTIPATSANLGPGFDCLGLALALYNHVTFTAEFANPAKTVKKTTLTIQATGLDAEKVPTDETNLVYQMASCLFERVGKRPSHLHIQQENHIPVGSGLGSSSTAVLAGLLGANALLDDPFTQAQLLDTATAEEGHPDNVAPALLGGLVLGVMHGEQVHIEPLPIAAQRVVIVTPDFQLLTKDARAALPSHISRQDAIFNASRLPLLTRALETAAYNKLALAMQDRLHQPYRLPLIPGMAAAFAAATAAGAAGVALSGAGPSLIAFAPAGHEEIVGAVTAVFHQHNLASHSWILPIDTVGAKIRAFQ